MSIEVTNRPSEKVFEVFNPFTYIYFPYFKKGNLRKDFA